MPQTAKTATMKKLLLLLAALFAISAGGICCSGSGDDPGEQEKPVDPPPSPDTAAHRGKQGRNWHLLLWAVVSLIKSDIQEAISMGRCSLLIVLLEDLISVVYTLLKIR